MQKVHNWDDWIDYFYHWQDVLGFELMLDKVELIAKERACCKITLEVLEGNEPAKSAYIKFGFAGFELDPKMGKALFWQKDL